MMIQSKFPGTKNDNNKIMTKEKSSDTSTIIKDKGIDTLPYNLEFHKLLRGILRHIPLILIITFISTALAAYYSYRLAHTYSTQSVLIYSQEAGKATDEKYQILHINLSSAIDMITLPVHLKAVKSILGLDLSIEELKKMISVALPGRDSNLISINVTANNPNLAIDIANTLADVVVKSTKELNQRQWQNAYSYFKNQETTLRQNLDEQSKEISTYRKDHRFMGMDIGSSSSLESLRNAEARLEAANLEYTRLLVEYENLNREFSKIPDRIPRAAAENSALKSKMLQIESALLDARSKYAPENPKIRALEDQLADLQKSVEKQSQEKPDSKEAQFSSEPNPLKEKLNIELIGMQAKLRAAQKMKEDIADTVTADKKEVANWSEEQSTFAKLLDRKNSLEYQIRANDQTQRLVEVMLNLGKGDLELYQNADKAFSLENSIWVELLPTAAFILGSLLGIGCSLVSEIFDKKIRTTKQVNMSYNLPCIATIPEWQLLWKNNSEKKSLFYIRQIAERLHLLEQFSSIGVASSISGEGKSSIAFHLAKYYANLGKKVLLLELDPRPNPFANEETLAPAFLESYLKGESSIDDITFHGNPARIKIGEHPHMKELVKGDAMKNLLSSVKKSYEIILIDTPGIIEEEFAINTVSLADICLFVIGSSIVDKKYVDASLREFEVHGVRPIGIVLNRVLPIYEENLRAESFDRKKRSNFIKSLFTRKTPE